MNNFQQYFKFITHKLNIDLKQLNQEQYPAFLLFPSFLASSLQEQLTTFKIQQKEQSLDDGYVTGSNLLNKQEAFNSNQDQKLTLFKFELKQFIQDVPQDYLYQLNDSRDALNPYRYIDVENKYFEFYHYNCFMRLQQICDKYINNIEKSTIHDEVYTVVNIQITNQFKVQECQQMQKTLQMLLEQNYQRVDLEKVSRSGAKLPIMLMNCKLIEPQQQMQQTDEQVPQNSVLTRKLEVQQSQYRFQIFDYQQSSIFNNEQDLNKMAEEIRSFTRDLGAKFLLIDENILFRQEMENTKTSNISYLNKFAACLQLIVHKQVVQSGGCAIIKCYEVNGLIYQQLLQIMVNVFFEEVVLVKPFFTNLASSERYIIFKNKRRMNYTQMQPLINNFTQILIQIQQAANDVFVPSALDEKFKFITSIFETSKLDNKLIKYVAEFNNTLLIFQNSILMHTIYHFYFSLFLNQMKDQTQTSSEQQQNYEFFSERFQALLDQYVEFVNSINNRCIYENREQLLGLMTDIDQDTFQQGAVYPEVNKRNQLQQTYLKHNTVSRTCQIIPNQLKYILDNSAQKGGNVLWTVDEQERQKMKIQRIISQREKKLVEQLEKEREEKLKLESFGKQDELKVAQSDHIQKEVKIVIKEEKPVVQQNQVNVMAMHPLLRGLYQQQAVAVPIQQVVQVDLEKANIKMPQQQQQQKLQQLSEEEKKRKEEKRKNKMLLKSFK